MISKTKVIQVSDTASCFINSDVCTENFISLRSVVKSDSICEGNGFLNVDIVVKTDGKFQYIVFNILIYCA